LTSFIWAEVHDADEVVLALVVVLDEVDVDDVACPTGTKTTSFMCSGSWQKRWLVSDPGRVSVRVEDPCVVVVDVLVELVVVELLVEHALPDMVKFPCRPMAFSVTAAPPEFLTCTVTVVVLPDTERARRLAVRFP
jgi:hypothetical protein